MRHLFAGLFVMAASFFATLPAHALMEDYPSVKLQGLDKSVGRTVTFEAKVGSTIQYGPLFIKIHACRKAPPIEKPESAAFLQIWEVPPGAEKSEWVFSGWMFASSPALSAMDHPVYDVWVLDCLGKEEPNEAAKAAETAEEADQSGLSVTDGDEAGASVPLPTDSEAEEPLPAEGDPATTTPEADAGMIQPTPMEDDPAAIPGESAPDTSTADPSGGLVMPEGEPPVQGQEAYPADPGPTPGTAYEYGPQTVPETPAAPARDGTTAYDYMNGRTPAPNTQPPDFQGNSGQPPTY